MRNIFDQYDQPENKLTHALVCALQNDPKRIRPFLKWAGAVNIPKLSELKIVEQQVPGMESSIDSEESPQRGLPDACIYTEEGWMFAIEVKVQAGISDGQLTRHRNTLARYGFQEPQMAIITVDKYKGKQSSLKAIEWREVYAWMKKRRDSYWADQLVDYLEVFESKMKDKYSIRGTLTMFDGLEFDNKHPYTYREGKRLLKLMGDTLQARTDLENQLNIDPKGKRRTAISGSGISGVWDFIPFKGTAGSSSFTNYTHLGYGVNSEQCNASVVIPNAWKGNIKTKFKNLGKDEFNNKLLETFNNLKPILELAPESKPSIYALQRHYKSQRSRGIRDGIIDADLRTLIKGVQQGVKYQPQWIEAIYDVITDKRSNIQLGIEMIFPLSCNAVKDKKILDLFAKSWIAMKPFIEIGYTNETK